MHIVIKSRAYGKTSARATRWELDEARAFEGEFALIPSASQAASKADPVCSCGMLLGSSSPSISPRTTSVRCGNCDAEHEIHA